MRLSFLCGGEVSLRPAAPARAVQAPAKPAVSAPAPARPAAQPDAPVAPTAVPEPQPAAPAQPAAPEPGPESAPARRRNVKVASSLSLNAMTQAAEAGPVAAAPSQEAALPDDDSVLERWRQMADDYKSRPRLASVLSSSKTELSEQDGVKVLAFYVVNVSQQGWIREKILPEFETKMRRMLGTPKIRLEVLVTPDEEIQKINYTQQEQAAALMKDNPEVKNLVTDMGLDI